MIEHEQIEFDVLFVGGGPAGLAGAIRLVQLARESGRELEVALIEKGADIGAHMVSGAILNPVALNELRPDDAAAGCPVETVVRGDEFYFLAPERHYPIPLVPRYMHNQGFSIISQSRFARWLGGIAEEMGINIFPGFTGKEVLYAEDGRTIVGIRTGDKGIDKDGKPKSNFEAGFDLMAKVTVFAEGARGSLTKEVARKLGIFKNKMPQVFEVGIKEVIQVPEENNYFAGSRGNDIHLMGYPLDMDTPGGGFIYEMKDNRIAIGFLAGLCYENPLLDPYDLFLHFKQHPFVARIIEGGKVIEQGARTVATGGWYSMPEPAVSGGLFVGGCAGIHNTPALKGIHVSMKSGMLAAETCFEALKKERFDTDTLSSVYSQRFEESWIRKEMYEGRNFAQALAKKGLLKFIHLGAQYVTEGKGVRDMMPLHDDASTLKPAAAAAPPWPVDPKTLDGTLYVDKLTGVYLSKTLHREDQPPHLVVHDTDLCVTTCYPTYKSPCTRFCPGKVYEMEVDEATGERKLKLNPSNCLHCKTCDIKDPYGNITWTCPEGGEGPNYTVV